MERIIKKLCPSAAMISLQLYLALDFSQSNSGLISSTGPRNWPCLDPILGFHSGIVDISIHPNSTAPFFMFRVLQPSPEIIGWSPERDYAVHLSKDYPLKGRDVGDGGQREGKKDVLKRWI